MSPDRATTLRRVAFFFGLFSAGALLQCLFFTLRKKSEIAVWGFSLLGSPFMLVSAILQLDWAEEAYFLAETFTGGLVVALVGSLIVSAKSHDR